MTQVGGECYKISSITSSGPLSAIVIVQSRNLIGTLLDFMRLTLVQRGNTLLYTVSRHCHHRWRYTRIGRLSVAPI